MEKLETIIMICSFCCVFAEFSGIMQWLCFKLTEKKISKGLYVGDDLPQTNLKPFNCAKCLSFWMGLLVFLIQGEGIMAIFYASVCMITSIYIVRYAK